MKKRRINFYLGISYGTSVSKVKEGVAGIKKIIEDDIKFDHSFSMVEFTEFGAYSLNIFILSTVLQRLQIGLNHSTPLDKR